MKKRTTSKFTGKEIQNIPNFKYDFIQFYFYTTVTSWCCKGNTLNIRERFDYLLVYKTGKKWFSNKEI